MSRLTSPAGLPPMLGPSSIPGQPPITRTSALCPTGITKEQGTIWPYYSRWVSKEINWQQRQQHENGYPKEDMIPLVPEVQDEKNIPAWTAELPPPTPALVQAKASQRKKHHLHQKPDQYFLIPPKSWLYANHKLPWFHLSSMRQLHSLLQDMWYIITTYMQPAISVRLEVRVKCTRKPNIKE